jgi:hypothetical protein
MPCISFQTMLALPLMSQISQPIAVVLVCQELDSRAPLLSAEMPSLRPRLN